MFVVVTATAEVTLIWICFPLKLMLGKMHRTQFHVICTLVISDTVWESASVCSQQQCQHADVKQEYTVLRQNALISDLPFVSMVAFTHTRQRPVGYICDDALHVGWYPWLLERAQIGLSSRSPIDKVFTDCNPVIVTVWMDYITALLILVSTLSFTRPLSGMIRPNAPHWDWLTSYRWNSHAWDGGVQQALA